LYVVVIRASSGLSAHFILCENQKGKFWFGRSEGIFLQDWGRNWSMLKN